MLIKKTRISKQTKFNFELEKAFSSETLFIQTEDIEKSILSMNMLCEYIRYCYFDDYIYYDQKKINKYCRMLLRYETCNQSILVKECQNLCKKTLQNAMNSPCSLKSMDLCFAMNESNHEVICDMCNDLMTLAMGRHVRALNE